MFKLFSLPNGILTRVTTRLVVVIVLAISITAVLGYTKLYQVTERNSSIRIDRAARTAVALFSATLSSEFTAIYNQDGEPLALRLKVDPPNGPLTFRNEHDILLNEIGLINQGAANLFRLNSQTNGFDRLATTFRRPDGSIPPPMSIAAGHPAYDDIFHNKPHLGEVPVMGRLRLAYLTPIQEPDGSVVGALAVDVGWVDDLVVARNELRTQILAAAILIILCGGFIGFVTMKEELHSLRTLARYSNSIASKANFGSVPYRERKDEIGALAQGLNRVAVLQNRLFQIAYTDELTGFGNRSRYLSDLEAAFNIRPDDRSRTMLMHLNLDNFKHINDAFGQRSGDELLRLVAERLSCLLGEEAQIARIATDEFTILINNFLPPQDDTYLYIILPELEKPFKLPSGEVYVNSSIGCIDLYKDASNADEAHRYAGLTLRKAKEQGGNQKINFSTELADELKDQVKLDMMLRAAIKERSIELYFQPQINPKTQALVGLEALARWTHPIAGSIAPNVFIPIAEKNGLIVDLGTLILDLACEQAAKWRELKFDFNHISVNVSPIQLWQPDFINVVSEALKRHGLIGEDIFIEITESVFVDQSEDRVERVINQVRNLGIKMSLDDFGSGYSCLGYLNRLPLDQIKVDRSFVAAADKDKRKQQVLKGILELASGLRFDVVAEGVETREEIDLLTRMGCRTVQGFFFARPTPAVNVPEQVQKIADTNLDRGLHSA